MKAIAIGVLGFALTGAAANAQTAVERARNTATIM